MVCERLWVATGNPAVGFYQTRGWTLVAASDRASEHPLALPTSAGPLRLSRGPARARRHAAVSLIPTIGELCKPE